MTAQFKEYPPGLGHIKVPTSSRAAAVAALTLYAPCRPRAVWMNRTAFFLFRFLGAAALPTRLTMWRPPMPREEWEALRARWHRDVTEFDEIVVAERTQRNRNGFAVLLVKGGTGRAFIKVRRSGRSIHEREDRVVREVWRAQPRSFSVPEPLGTGEHGNWSYLASAPLPSPLHDVPRDPPLQTITSEIGSCLRDLPRPAEVPTHWRPMHGDLTPWNLRQMADGRRLLFDWEEASWAPPGADEVLYRATAAVIGKRPPPAPLPHREAIAFWRDRVQARTGADNRDNLLDQALLDELDRLERMSEA